MRGLCGRLDRINHGFWYRSQFWDRQFVYSPKNNQLHPLKCHLSAKEPGPFNIKLTQIKAIKQKELGTVPIPYYTNPPNLSTGFEQKVNDVNNNTG